MNKCFSLRCTKYRCYSAVVGRKDICKITDAEDMRGSGSGEYQDLMSARIWSGSGWDQNEIRMRSGAGQGLVRVWSSAGQVLVKCWSGLG